MKNYNYKCKNKNVEDIFNLGLPDVFSNYLNNNIF